MNIKDKIDVLDKELSRMRSKCVIENRDPSADEVRRGKEILAELERLEGLQVRANRKTVEDGTFENRSYFSGGPFKNFGEQMLAVREAANPSGQTDPRLYQVRSASGLSESVPSEGGFLVQQDFASEILMNAWGSDEVLSRVTQIPVSGNGLKVNGIDETSRATGSRWGGVRAYWAAEADAATASKPKFRKINMTLHKLIGLCYATDELIEDAAALDGILSRTFQEEIRFQVVDAILNGSGAGQPLGIMNAGCVTQVDKETGQAPSTVVWGNIKKMWARHIQVNPGRCCWLINKNITPELLELTIAVGTGGAPIYLPANSAAGRPFNSLLGLPVVPIEQCQTLGTTGDILLADLSQYLLITKDMRADVSMHVRFLWDEATYRFVFRCNGQPVLDSAIVPYKGADDLSHFVKLQTRS